MSRTNAKVSREGGRGGDAHREVSRVADLSEFPAHAQPILVKSTFDEIMRGFAAEGRNFASLSLCAEVAYNETVEVTAQLPSPNPLRTAVACHLLDRLTPCGPGSTTYSPLLAALKDDVFCSIYAGATPGHFISMAAAGGRAGPETPSAGGKGMAALLNQTTFYQDYHAQMRRYRELEEEYEGQMLANEKQKVVLARVIARWQSMLVDRLFAAWRNFARDRTCRIDRRGAGMARLSRRSRLTSAFGRWRDFTRDVVETRLLEELQITRSQVHVIGNSAAGDRETLASELAHARARLIQCEDELARLRSDLQQAEVSLEQRDLRLASMRDEKAFWRAVALRMLTRTAPADRTMRLPEECVLGAFDVDDEAAGNHMGAGTMSDGGTGELVWSPSIMGELAASGGAGSAGEWSSGSTFTGASLQTQLTSASLGVVHEGTATNIDHLSRRNPFRQLLRHLPAGIQHAVLAFDSPATLVTVPGSLLVLGWMNSVIQRGSEIYSRLRRLAAYRQQMADGDATLNKKQTSGRFAASPSQTSTSMAQEEPTRGDAAELHSLTAGLPLPSIAPACNLAGDMANGVQLLLLADALGCFDWEDFGNLSAAANHASGPYSPSSVASSSAAGPLLPRITMDAPVLRAGGGAVLGGGERRERMKDSLLYGLLKASPDTRVKCAVDALFYRVVAVGSIASHGVEAFSVCTGRAAPQLLQFLAATLKVTTTCGFDSASGSAAETFAASHVARHRRGFPVADAPLIADECRAAVNAMQAAIQGQLTSTDYALKDADEQQVVKQYVDRLHAYDVKWGWINDALTQTTIAHARDSVPQSTASDALDAKVRPGEADQAGSSVLGVEPMQWVSNELFAEVCERAIQQVSNLPGVAQHGPRVLDAPLTKDCLAVSGEDTVGPLCETLLGMRAPLERVFRSYATDSMVASGTFGEASPNRFTVPNSRFQQFMTDHALYSQRHLPKKHAGSLFEALLAHELPGDEQGPELTGGASVTVGPASHAAGAGGSPMDESLAMNSVVAHPLDAVLDAGPKKAASRISGLNSIRFGAALVYVAASAAVFEICNACSQSLSTYGAGAGKQPPALGPLLATKLRTLVAALTPMAGTSTVSEVQSVIYHPDVQHALSKSNGPLLRVFTLAAGQDDDPEMSREEFTKLMAAGKIAPPVVPAGELERIFDFFSRDDGDGPSMVYRDFLEALVVVVQIVSPSPLTPLADRVRGFLRRREGSFLTAASTALTMRRVARR